MAVYKLGMLKGDDIGLEVVPEAVKVLNAAAGRYSGVTLDWCELPVGYPSYVTRGETLPASTLEALYGLEGWILGPIGHMAYPKDDPQGHQSTPHPSAEFRPGEQHPAVTVPPFPAVSSPGRGPGHHQGKQRGVPA